MFDPEKTLQLIERSIKKKTNLPFEIYLEGIHQVLYQSKDQKIEQAQVASSYGAGIRLFSEGKISFVSTSVFEKDSLEILADRLVEEINLIPKTAHLFVLPQKSLQSKRSGENKMSLEEHEVMKGMSLCLEKSAKSRDRRIQSIRQAQSQRRVKEVWIKNSEGILCEGASTRYELLLMLAAEEKNESQMAWGGVYHPDRDSLLVEDLGCRVADKALSLLGARSIESQTGPVLLEASVMASFLSIFATSFFADQINRGKSRLKDSLNQKKYDEKINISDVGELLLAGKPYYYEGFSFDAEGVAIEDKKIVEKGIIKSFMADLENSSPVCLAGNAFRSSFKELPRVGTQLFYLEPGQDSFEDLEQRLGTGFVVGDVLGLHTADVVSGDFSLGVSGYWVEKGRKSYPVRGVTLSGNLHQMLSQIDAVGHKLYFYQAFGAPSILVHSLKVGGS